jgi:hypothetical protein
MFYFSTTNKLTHICINSFSLAEFIIDKRKINHPINQLWIKHKKNRNDHNNLCGFLIFICNQ